MIVEHDRGIESSRLRNGKRARDRGKPAVSRGLARALGRGREVSTDVGLGGFYYNSNR